MSWCLQKAIHCLNFLYTSNVKNEHVQQTSPRNRCTRMRNTADTAAAPYGIVYYRGHV